LNLVNFLANRIAFNKQKTFSRFILRLSFIATVLSVLVMIVTVSMVSGFQEAVEAKIFNFWGHIRIQEKQPAQSVIEKMTPIEKSDSLMKELKKNSNVAAVHAFATQYALIKSKSSMEGVLLKGIEPGQHWSNYLPFLKSGKIPATNATAFSRGILLSTPLAKRLSLHVNDSLILYFTQEQGLPRARKVYIAGLFQTGIEEYDRLFALTDLRLLQQVSGWSEKQIGGYELFLHHPEKMEETAQALYDEPQFPATWDALSAKQLTPQLFDWLNMQGVTRNLLLFIMTVVAIINLITCLLVLVLERIKMIGLLKAMGATDSFVQRIFLRYALLLTTTGVLVGTALALFLIGLQQKTAFFKLDESAYYIDKVVFKVVPTQVLFIMGSTLLVSIAVLVVPTLLVKKISPLRAIRFN
jgi:lipoprotein-releasing system permease protein